jgi:RND family efflux transporter MFP subunit
MNSSETPSPQPSVRPVRISRVLGTLLSVLLIGLFAGLIPRWRQHSALRAETLELVRPTVNVVSPQAGQTGFGPPLPGEIKALVEAPIYSRASGYLKNRCCDIGARVAAGQLLAEIDTPELDHELAQAGAQLAQAEAALSLAKITAARWAELVKTESVSEQEAAEKQSDLALKSATVEAARANVRRLEDLQSFTQIIAPFAGTITARGADVGQLITAGSGKEIFHLAQTDTLRVYARVPQTAARSMSLGLLAELTIPELPGKVFPAKVVRTAGAMDAQSRTLLTELEVDNSSGIILAGSYAQVQFPDVKLDTSLTLPANTLLFRAEGIQVGVVSEQNLVELRTITLGRDFGNTVEVLDGVKLSDRIIVNPSDSLFAGTHVRVAEANPAANAVENHDPAPAQPKRVGPDATR